MNAPTEPTTYTLEAEGFVDWCRTQPRPPGWELRPAPTPTRPRTDAERLTALEAESARLAKLLARVIDLVAERGAA